MASPTFGWWRNLFRQWINKATRTYVTVKVLQIVCVAYIFIVTFAPAPVGLVQSNGYIDPPPRVAVKAANTYQMVCLAISRSSAYSLLPPLALIFLTKCKASLAFLANTPVSFFISILDAHELHIYVGQYIAFDVWIHTLFHLLRWADQGELSSLLLSHRTGLSGLVAVLLTPLITLPMTLASLKRLLSYETRKALHWLFLPFALALCLHVGPRDGFITWVVGLPLAWFVLDSLYVWLAMTERVSTSKFTVLPTGMQLTLRVSDKFSRTTEHGGFAYVCLPWVSKYQWHAFSLYEDPIDRHLRHVFMQRTGDWTTEVHKELQRDTRRPVWVQGPFPSPYNTAVHFDYQICVASGIGITAAISVINANKDSRRVSLIWILRDIHLLQFYLKHYELDDDGYNLIFYTGKDPVPPGLLEVFNVTIVQQRPNLSKVIPRLIQGIELSKVDCNLNKDVIQRVLTGEGGTHTEAPVVTAGAVCEAYAGAIEKKNVLGVVESPTLASSAANGAARAEAPPHVGVSMHPFGTVEGAQSTNGENVSANVLSKNGMGTRSMVERMAKGVEDVDGAERFVLEMSKQAKRRWGIMYCGGAKPVEDDLMNISGKFDIQTLIESFAW